MSSPSFRNFFAKDWKFSVDKLRGGSYVTLDVWTEEYRVGAPVLDGQHQMLFRLVHDLHEAATKGHGTAVVNSILDQLVQETRIHFRDEEAMLIKHRFPRYSTHRAEHQVLVNKIMDLQRAFRDGKATITVQAVQFLVEWHDEHIRKSDLQYAPYLAAK